MISAIPSLRAGKTLCWWCLSLIPTPCAHSVPTTAMVPCQSASGIHGLCHSLEPCDSVRSAVSGWIQHEEPERCQGCDAGCRGDCAAHTSPPGQSGGSSLSPTAGCGARRLIRLNSSMRKTSSPSFWCGIAPSWGSGQWDSGWCHVPNVLQLQGCRNKERGGTWSGGSSEEEAEKVPDEMKAAGRGWKKGHGQRF